MVLVNIYVWVGLRILYFPKMLRKLGKINGK